MRVSVGRYDVEGRSLVGGGGVTVVVGESQGRAALVILARRWRPSYIERAGTGGLLDPFLNM